jgi:hypothetical protein
MKTKTVQRPGRPKFARIHQVRAENGLTDSTIYRLITAKLIRSVDVRRPGCIRGTRLIDLESLDNYLNGLAEEQAL